MTEPTTAPAPVEGKVWASTAGAGAGLTVSAFLVWLLGVTVWGASSDAGQAASAAAAVPAPVTGLLLLGITAGGTFLSGYRAKHTPRSGDSLPLEALTASYISPVLDSSVTEVRFPPADPSPSTDAAQQALDAAADAHPMPAGPTEANTELLSDGAGPAVTFTPSGATS